MSSAVITNTADAVRESFCSFLETEVTSTSIRSSRVLAVRSAEFCCGHAGIVRNATIASDRSIQPARRHGRRLARGQKAWQVFRRLSLAVGFPFVCLYLHLFASREDAKCFAGRSSASWNGSD